ncbi:hypothetical protein Q7P37_003736 [Cladosporium fusiforme]
MSTTTTATDPNLQPPILEWHKQLTSNDTTTTYLISTSPSKLNPTFINASFATPDMYWAKPLPLPALELMLAHSLTLGLYIQTPHQESQQIGLARFTTDHVSFAYLSDVYISPAHRARGLGAWLMQCCAAVMDGMPHLRRAMLMAAEGAGAEYYGRVFGMRDVAGSQKGLVCLTRKGEGSALGD